MASAIQITGVGEETITLSSSQLIGNRSLLINTPEDVRLEIRPVKRPLNVDDTVQPEWRLYTGRQLPDGDTPSATVFNSHVFETFQQAMLDVLFHANGGATNTFVVNRFSEFPHFIIGDASHVIEPRDDTRVTAGPIAVHLLRHEPGPKAIAAFAASLFKVDPPIMHCLFLVGSLLPQTRASTANNAEAPQLHGILVCIDGLSPPLLGQTLPPSAVEHGWYPCVKDGVLRFAYQGQSNGVALAPAVIPSLASIGHRIWRKGQCTYAVVPRVIGTPPTEWDSLIKSFLQAMGE